MSVLISGCFPYRDRLLSAIKRIKEAGIPISSARLPVPDHEVLEALDLKSSKVGLVTLVGGIVGMLVGFFGPAIAHLHWGLILGGKPVFAVPPFVITGFELTILFGATATLAGLLIMARMVRKKPEEPYDARVSEDHYLLIIEASEGQAAQAKSILEEEGAEVLP
jgi:hypothetical protein